MTTTPTFTMGRLGTGLSVIDHTIHELAGEPVLGIHLGDERNIETSPFQRHRIGGGADMSDTAYIIGATHAEWCFAFGRRLFLIFYRSDIIGIYFDVECKESPDVIAARIAGTLEPVRTTRKYFASGIYVNLLDPDDTPTRFSTHVDAAGEVQFDTFETAILAPRQAAFVELARGARRKCPSTGNPVDTFAAPAGQ